MSCVGIVFVGYLLLNLWMIIGYALSLPFTLPDLMAGQQPPLEPHGFDQHAVLYGVPATAAAAVMAVAGRGRPCPWWMFLLRTGLLLALASAATAWAGGQYGPLDGSTTRLLAQSGAAAVVAFLSYRVVLRNSPASAVPGRRRPAPGEIWHAVVPFRDSEGSKQRYCVVVGTRADHVEVLKITSKNKDHRADHIRMPNDGWDLTSGLDHWVEIGLPPLRVPYADFTNPRPKGRCPKPVWRQLQAHHPAPVRPANHVNPRGPAAPTLWARITQYLG